MSYERMKKDDEKLRQKVAELLRAAEKADAEEDAQYGKNRRGDELPDELQRAEDRRARIGQLMAELEAEAAEQHESSAADDDDNDDDAPPSGPAPLPSHKIPAERASSTAARRRET